MNGGVFREDRYTSLSLEIVRVHDSFRNRLIFSENTALFQHLVHKRRLSVIDVRDDRDVSEIFSYHILKHTPRPPEVCGQTFFFPFSFPALFTASERETLFIS